MTHVQPFTCFAAPGCERALTVPASAPTPPPPAAAPGTVQFDCACGKLLRVKAEYAGRLTRCPECGAQTTVPERETNGAGKARIRPDRKTAG